MKTRTWITAAAVGTAALAMLAWAFAPRPIAVEVATATLGRFEASIDEDAKTRLRERFVVSAPLGGLLERTTLREGDEVVAGAIVATLTPALSPMLDARTVREQQARVDIAQAQVQRARARFEGAQVALRQANGDLLRSEQLATQGFIAPTRLENDRLAVLAAQKNLDAAAQESKVAGHEVEQARAALQVVGRPDRDAGSFYVRAPIAGRVLRVVQASEGVVALGAPLLELGDTRELEVVAELLTADALRATPGSRVLIERWGGEGALEGRVRRVEPAAFTKVSALGVEEQRVKVLIDIHSPPEQWRALGDGFRVGVRVVTLAVDKAVKVPLGAVFPLPDDGGAPGGMAVFVIEDGRARRVAVQVGARNGSDAWIRGGMGAGTAVIIYPPANLVDGARVRTRSV